MARQLVYALILSVTLSGTTLASAPPVPLSGMHEVLELGAYAERLQDPQAQLSWDELPDQGWLPPAAASFSAGFSTSAWWWRVTLLNDSASTQDYFLDTVSSVADYLDLYLLREDGQLQVLSSGDRRAFDTRALPLRTVVQPLRLEAGERLQLYLRMASWDGLHEVVHLRLLTADAFVARQQLQSLALGIYYGTLIAILLYNLFLFLFIRERVFGLYVFYVAAFLVWSYILRGYGLQYLWPDSPHFNNQALPVAANFCYISFGLFALDYLQIKARAPHWLYRALWLAIVLNLLACLPALLGYYALSFAISLPTGTLMVLLAVVSGVMMGRRGSRAAHYFLVAFGFLAAGVLLYYLQLTGVIRAGALSEYGVQIGSALEVLLLAFGLADQMNSLKADKLRAERQARQAQNQLATRLADEVQQRTVELEQANRRLETLASVDELTGALNRRRFNQMFEQQFDASRQAARQLAFCMIDIDLFKRYNDQAGHQAGDEILKKISRCLQAELNDGEAFLFRLGGEEFGLLLTAGPHLHAAEAFVERLREQVAALGIAHPDPDCELVTASFGLAIRTADSTLNQARQLYKRADELLYQAKSRGRNQLVTALV